MSDIANVEQTRNQLTTNYDLSKFLLGFNSFVKADVTASEADVTLSQGLVMGRISATGKIVPFDDGASDGSQYPVGLCIVDQTVADGDTEEITLVNKGRVAQEKINFADVETLDTVVDGRQVRDWLALIGLELESREELTGYDND